MKIKIRKDAGEFYIQDKTDYRGVYHGKDRWETILFKLAGKVVEVNTEELFKNEFITLPIPGVTKKGIKIPEYYVVEVVDDIRPGKARCDFCNEVSDSNEVCTHCGRRDYLDEF